MFLPEFDKDYLIEKGYLFEERLDNGVNGLIIKNWGLPEGVFNLQTSDLLIIIPSGYPEVGLDMWYFEPPILLSPSNRPARQTVANINFNNKVWQRWSRHYPPNEWRSGVDGIHTYLKRIETALQTAT